MTRCMVRRDFFHENTYKITLTNPNDIEDMQDQGNAPDQGKKPLIEFCLPFTELKHIVEGMADEETELQFEYPVGDNFLQIKIPEDSRGAAERVT